MENSFAEDLVNRLYKRLFYLPRTALLSVAYVVEGFVIALSSPGPYRIFPQIFISVSLGLAVYLFLIYMFFVIIGGAVDTVKKSLGVAVLSSPLI